MIQNVKVNHIVMLIIQSDQLIMLIPFVGITILR